MLRVEPEIEARYVAAGQVRLAFHPILDIGQASRDGAIAVECAARQQPATYWPLHKLLFERQDELWNTGVDLYVAAAEEIGLVGPDLRSCMEDPEVAAKVERLDQERREAGVRQRPTFDINGRRIEGALPLTQLQQVIDEALAGGG